MFVERRRWLSDETFASLLALSQFLPGPASSQLGFSIGLTLAGWRGAIAAFVAFTLPSALAMYAFALLLTDLTGPASAAAIHGLKLVALVVITHGLLGMARSLCPDTARRVLALFVAVLLLFTQSPWMQLVAIGVGGLTGFLLAANFVTRPAPSSTPVAPSQWRTALLGSFVFLLVLLPLVSQTDVLADIAATFYRAGALVFGGGHVVLPLLEEAEVAAGDVEQGDFLAGYGAAQAVPGPMFTLATYLGALIAGPAGAIVATLAIFLPGFLLIAGLLPFWQQAQTRPQIAGAVAGVNAAVVGLLAAALIHPVAPSAIRDPLDAIIAAAVFAAVLRWSIGALGIVAACVFASLLRWAINV